MSFFFSLHRRASRNEKPFFFLSLFLRLTSPWYLFPNMAPAPVRLLGVVPAAASGAADCSSLAARAPVKEEKATRSTATMESVVDFIFRFLFSARGARSNEKRCKAERASTVEEIPLEKEERRCETGGERGVSLPMKKKTEAKK